MQRAMVATRVGVISETLEDGYTASLVNPGNPHELSKSILALLSDDGLRRKMGYNARDLVEKEYSWDVVASKTLKIYEEILEQKN
jgi:glycosyltransferase involved in cell wall biosynthesis